MEEEEEVNLLIIMFTCTTQLQGSFLGPTFKVNVFIQGAGSTTVPNCYFIPTISLHTVNLLLSTYMSSNGL